MNLIGQTILNQYRVEARLGSGGIGDVYRVWDLQRHANLAMKVFDERQADNQERFRYLRAEARILRDLSHPNIVRFYDFQQLPGLSFLLENYVDGQSLKEKLRRWGGSFTPAEVLAVYRNICPALGFTHSSRILHCDIKPGNILIDGRGQAYLADFSNARFADQENAGPAGGSPPYMAPEQIQNQPLSPQTDIYALGVMLYELLAGRRPFQGTADELKQQHCHAHPPSLRAYNSNISPDLEAVVMRCLDKDPRRRYPSAMAVLDALTCCISPLDTSRPGTESTRVPARSETVPPIRQSAVVGIPSRRPTSIWPYILILVAAFLVTALAGIVMMQQTALPPIVLNASPVPPRRPTETQMLFLPTQPVQAGAVIPPVVPVPPSHRVTPPTLPPTRLPTRVIPTVPATATHIPPIASGPVFYTANACMILKITPQDIIQECVTGIELQPDSRLKVFVSWQASLQSPGMVKIDANYPGSYYLRDEAGRKYPLLQAGGAANQIFVLANGSTVQGWLLFPSLDAKVRWFSLVDNNDKGVIETASIPRLWP